MDVISILEARGIDYVVKGSGEISIHCPNAISHQDGTDSIESFNINIDRLESHCFVCNLSMNTAKLTKWLLGEDLDELEYKCLELKGKLSRLQNTTELPLVNTTDKNIVVPFGKPIFEPYRNISVDTYKKLNALIIERGRYANRIVMPVVVNGSIIGLDGRALDNSTTPKYLRNANSSCSYNWLYPFDIVKASKPSYVILCEGIFHSIKALDVGFPALCYFGVNNWSMNKVIMVLSLGVSEVIICPDRDEAGFKAVDVIGNSFKDWITVSVANTDRFQLDPLATLVKGKQVFQDLADLNAEEIQWAIDNRRKF